MPDIYMVVVGIEPEGDDETFYVYGLYSDITKARTGVADYMEGVADYNVFYYDEDNFLGRYDPDWDRYRLVARWQRKPLKDSGGGFVEIRKWPIDDPSLLPFFR